MDERHQPTLDAIALADAVQGSIPDLDIAIEVIEADRLGNQTALFALVAGVREVTNDVRSMTLAILRARRNHPDPFEGL